MSVHYKFKSAVEYDTLPVDGLNISLGDLKEAIIQQKRLGKGQPYDLQITNAETKEVYHDEKILIPKNSSLIVARVPIDPSQMKRPWENKEATALILANPSNLMNTEDAVEAAHIDRKIKEVTDLTRMEGSEQDKINAMVAQSTIEYHPSKYVKLRASKMTGVVPSGYKCYKCNKSGHWVTMCPLNNQDLRKSTGIPSMFLEEVKDPSAPGVMISATGKLVRLRDMIDKDKIGIDFPPIERQPPPEELECPICNELLKDAVLIPCCADAFCDECIRNHLLDTEERVCPSCQKEGIGPDTLIPNRYLRIKVQQFECGCFFGEKKSDSSSDVGEPMSVPVLVRNTPTPPRSPGQIGSPARIRISDKPVSPAKIRISDKPVSPAAIRMSDKLSGSPARIRVSDKPSGSPTSQTALSPVNQTTLSPVSQTTLSPTHETSPSKISVIEPIGNGHIESDREIGLTTNEKSENGDEIHDAASEKEFVPPEKLVEGEMQPMVEEKENIGLNEDEADVDEKPKKIKKKKAKRKNSRHESEEEKEEKERKKRERRSSHHKSQDKKVAHIERRAKRRGMELLKDVADLPDKEDELWDDGHVSDKMLHRNEGGEVTGLKKKKKHRQKGLLNDVDSEEENEVPWNVDPSKTGVRETATDRSRSNSGEKEKEPATLYDNIVPFNPLVPPPNVFVKSSPPQDYRYPVTTNFVNQVPPTHPVPVTSDATYPRYQPGIPPPTLTNPPISYPRPHSSYTERELIADPLTEFQKHLREKDELKRKWRYSRSRSPSRSPRYRRVRSRSRQRSWSRSRSRSLSRVRVTRSPRSPSRRRWSRSPLPRGHASFRSRSPSFPRERSLSDCSLSLSRTPSPSRRIKTPPLHVLPVHPPVLPDPHALARNPVEYGVPRDYNRYQPLLPNDQFPHQPPYIPGNPPHWDQHARYNQPGHENFKPNFPDQRGRGNMDQRGRGIRGRRGRGGFRQGENFGYDHRGQDYRHQYDRSQRMHEDRRGMPGGWEREGRQCYNTEIPRNDRGNRHPDGERRRFGDHCEYDEIRTRRDNSENVRRNDDAHPQNAYSDEDEWRRYSDDGRKREEDPHRRRFEGRRGHDDRKDDPDLRKASDIDDYEDFKRTRKEGDGRKSYERGPLKDVDDGRPGRLERDGKHRGVSRRDSPRDEEMHFRSKSYDSPGKSHNRKSPLRDRKEVDRRDKEKDKRDRLEVDKKAKDGYRRDRDVDRRERDKQERESERKEKDSDRKEYDRKDTYKRERDQERKLRDGDKRDKEGDRREREGLKKDRDYMNKDKNERNDDRDRAYVSRWDHGDTKVRNDKEMEGKSKSRERERSIANEEKEHKRKSKRREEKEEGHHTKEKGDGAPDSENPTKGEKKKHDKKKKKKEKRRASQASTEASQGEASGDEGEDKKKKKKREKKRKGKGTVAEEESEEVVDNKVPVNDEKSTEDGDLAEPVCEAAPEKNEEENNDPEITPPREGTPDPKPSEESPSALLPIPPLSKWERDEDLTLTPKGLVENKAAPEEEKKVTVDILKRAENTIFSGRGLATRKVFLDPQKQKEPEEKERSPTPEWDRMELREAKRRGPSIQITISSKTESQIGRPRGGRYQQSSPERPEEKRYTLRSRRVPESDGKSEKRSRSQKRSQSPSEPQSTIKTRRKSERDEHVKGDKESSVSNDRSDINEESITSHEKLKVDDADKNGTPVKDDADADEDAGQNDTPDTQHESEYVPESSSKQYDNLLEDTKPLEGPDVSLKEEKNVLHKGVKRSSSSTDELEVKKLKVEDEPPATESVASKNVCGTETFANIGERKSFVVKGEPEYSIPVLGESRNSNLVMVPIARDKTEELEEGEITDSSSEGNAPDETEPILEAPLELRGMVQDEEIDETDKSLEKIRYSPIRVPSPVEPGKSKETLKVKEKSKKRKKRKRSSSSSSSNSSSSSSSSSSEEEEIVKKKKKKKKKKKVVDSDSSDGESQRKHKKKKKEKKKKKKKEKKKKSDK